MGKTKLKVDTVGQDFGKAGFNGRAPELIDVEGIPDGEKKARTVAQRNTNHCVICRLHHLGHLRDRPSDDLKQASLRHAAAERLQDDHAMAGLASIPSTLSALGAGGGSTGPAEIAQIKIDAADRKKAALRAVGRSGRAILVAVVVDDMTVNDARAMLGLPPQGVLPALRVALDVLALHYGISADIRGRIRGGAAQPIHPFQEFD
jgi:hypothetical protein